MRFFERLITTIKGCELEIIEATKEIGFRLYGPWKGIGNVGATATLQACKELALEKYGAPLDGWRSEGKSLESLISISSGNKPGYTFRIVETGIENGHLWGEAAYLYGFDEHGYEEYDYGQNTVQVCKEFALEEFDIPLDTWREEE